MRDRSFLANRYLSWYVARVMRHDGAINLHSSGVAALEPEPIEIPGPDPWAVYGLFETALARWLGVPAEELIFTPGATGGTLLAILALVRPEADVVVESPIYEPMLRQALRANPTRRVVRRMEHGWRLPVEELQRLIGPQTGLVMITEPHNPSGVFSTKDEVLELAALAARHGAPLLINEVYRGFSDRPSYHGAADNIVIVSSLSKLMGAYTARLGWLGAKSSLIERLRQAHMNFGAASAPSAAAGLGVLEKADALRARAVLLSKAGQPVVDAFVRSTPGLEWVLPQGPGYGCVRLPANSGARGASPDRPPDVCFAERLHDERGVLLVPGTLFEVPGTVRLSWLGAGDRLDEGLQRLAEALASGD